MYLRPFEAQGGGSSFAGNSTVNIVVTASNQVLAVNATPLGNRSVRIANIGTQTIFVAFGISTTTASVTGSMPILPNTVETFFMRNENTHIAVIASSTGSTMYVTTGEGI